jgi:hypothetical protein
MIYDHIGLRTMGDVDLLVREVDLPGVEQELLGMGCTAEDQERVVTK